MTHETRKAESVDKEANSLHRKHPENPPRGKPRLAPKTRNSHDHWIDLQDAVSEKDIICLRTQLKEILYTGYGKDLDHQPVFDTTDELDIGRFLGEREEVNPETIKAGDALPRIHVHHHRRASFENIHYFYTEQVPKPQAEDPEEAGDDPGWHLMADALQEKDVIELRESLRQIASVVSIHGISAEEIDNYISGSMEKEEKIAFESEMILNQELKNDVRLSFELREAAGEKDIMAIREQILRIMQSQHSTSKGLDEIEAFLENRLDPSLREAFLSELSENDDLKAEVNLVRNLDAAFKEHDISVLRYILRQLSGNLEQQNIKSFLPVKITSTRRAGMFAAVFIFLTVLSSVTWLFRVEGRKDYQKYFVVPEAATVFRSGGNDHEVILGRGMELYNKADYTSALVYFSKLLENDDDNPVAHFYAGASCQNLRQFREAVDHYNSVIEQSDNLFIEQAEWLVVFCHLQISENREALRHLEAIIERKGFYEKDAIALLSIIRENGD